MIYTEIKGRLGNQLFKYAYSRALQIKRGNHEDMCFSFNNMKGRNPLDGWEDSLKYFNVKEYRLYKGNGHLVFEEGNIDQRIVATIFYVVLYIFGGKNRKKRASINRKFIKILNRFGLHINYENNYNFKDYNGSKVFVDGTFQDKHYFDDIREVLLEELTPKQELLGHNKELYDLIRSTNSVCVSIRRGDYVSNPAFEKTYNICTKEYFEKAAEIIKKKVDNPVFIFFSDDIEWVKNNVDFDSASYYEKGDDPIWEKLRLMYSCKHFIISNSTFSWWAQYLGRYNKKLVIAPRIWEKGGYESYLIDDSFITIDID